MSEIPLALIAGCGSGGCPGIKDLPAGHSSWAMRVATTAREALPDARPGLIDATRQSGSHDRMKQIIR